MILIADSGSTKTDWRLISADKEIQQFKTTGFNPYFQSTEDIQDALQKELIPEMPKEMSSEISEIYFYGAGCSTPEKCEIVKKAIATLFPKRKIEIEHDLLAAARALCGREEGIAAILGTGSNSCYYDGEEIKEHVQSLGYILGDEGSGAYLGKKILQKYLYQELPKDLSDRFAEKFKVGREEILDSIYKKPLPSRYLATYSKFLFDNLKHPLISDLVYKGIEDFFIQHICKYSKYKEVKFNCVGSVGFYFGDILRRVASDKGITIGRIIESPISGLTMYHLNEQ